MKTGSRQKKHKLPFLKGTIKKYLVFSPDAGVEVHFVDDGFDHAEILIHVFDVAETDSRSQ